MDQNPENYRKAREKVARMKRFYKHLSTWMFTSIFLFVLFIFLRMPPWITMVVIAGWGIGVAAEAAEVFGFPGMDKSWEERKIREEIDRMDRIEKMKKRSRNHTSDEDEFDLEDEELDLEEFKELRKNWRDSDFV